tara:strand:- start:1800 stop:3758 length:1959 start_codon:yes stop_codon:yes gene_type:complete
MIDYTTYKKKYTAGGTFTLTGSDFIGYVAVDVKSGEATEADTGKLLKGVNTYETDLLLSPHYKDRVVSDLNLTLPKTLDECTFGINDNFNYELLKSKLDNVRDNNTYMFSRLFIAANELPFANSVTFAAITSVSDTTFRTINSNDITAAEVINTIPFSQSRVLSSVGEIIEVSSQIDQSNLDHFALFAVTSSTFISMTGSNTNLNIVEQSTGYETTDENELSFKEIAGIATNKNYAFISDKANNVVIKYDITGFTSGDVAKSLSTDTLLGQKRNFIELVGGYGGATRQTKFNAPTTLACDEQEIAVFDSGNRVIKIFDINFNFITSINSINLNNETFGGMEYDPDFGVLYVVTYAVNELNGRNTAYLYRFSTSNQSDIERVELQDFLQPGEVVKEVSFSKASSNFWYFTTQRSVYKKFKTRPAEVIGSFGPSKQFLIDFQVADKSFNNRWNYQDVKFKDAQFVWNLQEVTNTDEGAAGVIDNDVNGFNIFQGPDGNDKIILSTNSRFYFFNEPTTTAYEKVLKDDNYNNYGKSVLSLNKEEYIQTSTINKEIFKLIKDILIIKNNIVGRFRGKYKNNVLVLDDYGYNLDFSKFIQTDLENIAVHSNEEALVEVLNRSLKEIYTMQLNITNLITTDIESKPQRQYNLRSIIEI